MFIHLGFFQLYNRYYFLKCVLWICVFYLCLYFRHNDCKKKESRFHQLNSFACWWFQHWVPLCLAYCWKHETKHQDNCLSSFFCGSSPFQACLLIQLALLSTTMVNTYKWLFISLSSKRVLFGCIHKTVSQIESYS